MNKSTHLVLLSGLLCDNYVWKEVASKLSCSHQIFSFAGFDNITDMAKYVLANTPDQFTLVGHSMGGRVAIEAYILAPERIVGLGLFNTGVHPKRDEEVAGRQALIKLALERGMSAVADKWLPPMLSSTAISNAQLIDNLKAMVERHSVADFQQQIHALLTRPNAQSVLPAIDVPTLLLSGDQDNWSPINQHKDMLKRLTHGNLIALPNAGHMSIVERPYDVANAIKKHLL